METFFLEKTLHSRWQADYLIDLLLYWERDLIVLQEHRRIPYSPALPARLCVLAPGMNLRCVPAAERLAGSSGLRALPSVAGQVGGYHAQEHLL